MCRVAFQRAPLRLINLCFGTPMLVFCALFVTLFVFRLFCKLVDRATSPSVLRVIFFLTRAVPMVTKSECGFIVKLGLNRLHYFFTLCG